MSRALWLIGLLGCGPRLLEGDDPQECRDGADNDRNGLFDCEDDGCAPSPDCDGFVPDTDHDSDPDTDTDSDTDTDTVDPEDPLPGVTTVDVTYALAFDFDDSLCTFGVCDCTNHYEGTGERLSHTADHVTFLGTWALTDSDCSSDLKAAIWVPKAPGTAHHTLWVPAAGTIDGWITHKNAADVEPSAEPSKIGQYYLTDLAAPLADGAVHYELEETDNSSGTTSYYRHTLDLTLR